MTQQYVIIARDNAAPGTLEKRLACRETHLATIHAMKAAGTILDGGALLDEGGRMVGSIILCQFQDREALDSYLDTEIYQVEGVWLEVEVISFRRVPWC